MHMEINLQDNGILTQVELYSTELYSTEECSSITFVPQYLNCNLIGFEGYEGDTLPLETLNKVQRFLIDTLGEDLKQYATAFISSDDEEQVERYEEQGFYTENYLLSLLLALTLYHPESLALLLKKVYKKTQVNFTKESLFDLIDKEY